MSFNYDRYDTRRRRTFTTNSSGGSSRGGLGYWLPLIVTVTAATAGIATWIWRERQDSDEYYDDSDFEYSDNASYARKLERERRKLSKQERYEQAVGGPPSYQGVPRPGEVGVGVTDESINREKIEIEDNETTEEGFVAQMRGAIKRTPSPQKLFDGARASMAAGMAAVGKGLGSIAEGSERAEGFDDQEAWSEEAEVKQEASARSISSVAPGGARPGRKRMVCVVVSAESDEKDAGESSYQVEHASILSHLVGHADSETTDLIILIYAPNLQSHPFSSNNRSARPSRPSSSHDGSFEQVDANEAQEAELISQWSSAAQSPSSLYTGLTTQAATLVSHPTRILPFTSPNGHVHLLRHLSPSLVYMQESLCGKDGEVVSQIQGWVGQTVVLIGAEGAGLVDTETEDEGARQSAKETRKWWQDETKVGLGKGVEIVDVLRVGEDWDRRVGRA